MKWIFKTKRIMVRPIQLEDAKIFVKWWNDGDIMKDVGFKNGLNTTLDQVKKQFIKKINSTDISETKLFIIYDALTVKPIGELSYGELDLNEKSCRIGIKICEINHQGKGYGHESLCMFLNYLFEQFDLEIIYIDTLLSNTRAIHLYNKIGSEMLEIKNDFWTNPEGISYAAIFFKLPKEKFNDYYKCENTK